MANKQADISQVNQMHYCVNSIEASSSDGLGGGYSSASETTPGRFTINLFRPMEVSVSSVIPLFEAIALSLHEANPGHHMQHSYSMKADLPDFRRDPMLSFYNIPSWFPYYSAYQEGWGLYSEYLGEEMGLYEDDYEMVGRYSYDILRACRLVVDTGLHYYRWSRAEAIEYLQNYTIMAYDSAANEIDRYITWPGQACAYKVGEIKIRELRKHAEEELGSRFNIQEFHLQVLENGAMPMSVLESLIKRWIQDIKSETSSGACAYKVGEIKIRELRKHAEEELGERSRFNIQEFHLQVLENGAMPMNVLKSLVKRWIQDIKSETSSG
ncbi:hypothetical protein MAR_014482, partial [Mya arenaria]